MYPIVLPPSYESHYFTEGQRIRHVIHTYNTISIWVGTFSKNGVLYKGHIFSLNEFAKSHRRNIIGWKECEVDGWKECEYEVGMNWDTKVDLDTKLDLDTKVDTKLDIKKL